MLRLTGIMSALMKAIQQGLGMPVKALVVYARPEMTGTWSEQSPVLIATLARNTLRHKGYMMQSVTVEFVQL